MCTWIEIVRNAIILYYFIGVFHLRENVVMFVPETNETKFSAKIWPFSRDWGISSRYHLSQLFTTIFATPFLQLHLAKEWPTAQDCRFTAIPESLDFIFYSFVIVILLKWHYYSFQILAENWLLESGAFICWSLWAFLFVILTKTFQWLILSTNVSKLFFYTTYLRSL